MIDWDLVAKIAGGGFGVTIATLLILCLIVWVIGIALQRIASRNKKGNDAESEKG